MIDLNHSLSRPFRLLRASLLHVSAGILSALLVLPLLALLLSPQSLTAQTPPPPQSSASADLPAPTKLYPEPRNHLLFPVGGDFAFMRHSTGFLDRAARLQARVEAVLRGVERWSDDDERFLMTIYVMTLDDWELERFDMPFGIPMRVGNDGIAAPARGTEQTVALWRDLLQGDLPQVVGLPIRGTPEEAAALVLSDVLVQLLVGEALVDYHGIGGDAHWVRGVMSHLIAALAVVRLGTDRPEDIESLYAILGSKRGERAFAVSDYDYDLKLEDWLWFQAQFHLGARILLEKEGKDSLKKMLKMTKKNDGVLRGEDLRRKYKRLDEWYRARFAAVSLQTRRDARK